MSTFQFFFENRSYIFLLFCAQFVPFDNFIWIYIGMFSGNIRIDNQIMVLKLVPDNIFTE